MSKIYIMYSFVNSSREKDHFQRKIICWTIHSFHVVFEQTKVKIMCPDSRPGNHGSSRLIMIQWGPLSSSTFRHLKSQGKCGTLAGATSRRLFYAKILGFNLNQSERSISDYWPITGQKMVKSDTPSTLSQVKTCTHGHVWYDVYGGNGSRARQHVMIHLDVVVGEGATLYYYHNLGRECEISIYTHSWLYTFFSTFQ